MKDNVRKHHLQVQALCEGAVLIGAAQLLSYLKLFANLPNGGSITLSAFPIALYALRWGLGKGLLAGFAFGTLQLIFDGAYAWGWQSMVLDYLLAFTPLGLAGLFQGKAWGIFPGIVLGNVGRFLVHYFSGVTVYRINQPTKIPGLGSFDDAALYSLVYNGAYMLPNLLLALGTAILLFLPMKRFFSGQDLKK